MFYNFDLSHRLTFRQADHVVFTLGAKNSRKRDSRSLPFLAMKGTLSHFFAPNLKKSTFRHRQRRVIMNTLHR